ncbi:long-chain-alcohol oxidase FAO3-like [Wolffia australiana]
MRYLPNLTVIARQFLAVSPTSAPVERLFSVGRGITMYRRSRLDAESIEMLMMLRAWFRREERDSDDSDDDSDDDDSSTDGRGQSFRRGTRIWCEYGATLAQLQCDFGAYQSSFLSLSLSSQQSLNLKGFTAFKDQREETINVECDVVIVGSGCDSGVAAAVLAAVGHKFIVLEKGNYSVAEDYTGNEGPSIEKLYETEGILSTVDGSTMVLAGSTVGGGSAINWGACIKTPAHVMAEWAEERRLPLFGSPEYLSAMDTVCERIGVTDHCPEESLQNKILRRGCLKLGLNVESVPRNSPEDHFCGSCSYGCPTGKKGSTDTTWLVDAVERGAVILTGCQAEKFLLEKSTIKKKKKCVGVAARAVWGETKKQLKIRAKASVSAGGALRTPPLLAASGLKNRHVGKNLHIHPGLMAWGYFPDEDGKMFEGGVITAVHKVDVDDGRGTAIIEALMLGPGAFSVSMPWVDGRDMKDRMSRYSRTAHLAVLARDQSAGSVNWGIRYRLEESDKEVLRRGLRRALQILVAAGASEVGTHRSDGQRIKCKGYEELEEFLDGVGIPAGPKSGSPTWVLFGTGHQMGSCRMGAIADEGAIDKEGESWEAEGLFVCDASLFPSALGVNPMITIQSISLCLSQRLARSMVARKDDA